jgi:hypothetical protein
MYHGSTGAKNTAEIPALIARSRWKNVPLRIRVFIKAEGQKEVKTGMVHLKTNPDVLSINSR